LSEDKKAQIKEAIRQLHSGVPPEQVKEKFRNVLEGTGSLEIAKIEEEPAKEGMLKFETGNLTKEQLEALLNTLPVDITFVDANDTVQYFNKPEKRFFVRTKAVIGRKVAMCHPQKSLHIVSRIVESFKSGKKDTAEFWITMQNRMLYIRFFAVRDGNGKYLGA
jgi:DUF438 domain-containing protein